MKVQRIALAAVASVFALSLAACGGDDSGDEATVDESPSASFAAGSTMERLSQAGAVTVGTR